MAEYQLSALAEIDVQEIAATTIVHWGVKQAKTYLEKLHSTLMTLANNPNLGRPRDEVVVGIKSFPLGKHCIFYLPVHQGIEVARILHQRMDPNKQFDDMT